MTEETAAGQCLEVPMRSSKLYVSVFMDYNVGPEIRAMVEGETARHSVGLFLREELFHRSGTTNSVRLNPINQLGQDAKIREYIVSQDKQQGSKSVFH
jgi:hypothetical protein